MTAFGCFGGDFRIDNKLLLSRSYKMSDILSDKFLSLRNHSGKTRRWEASGRTGVTHVLLGGLTAKKWGRSRSICLVLPVEFRKGVGWKALQYEFRGPSVR